MKKTILAFAILTLIPKLTFCQELEYIKKSKSYPAHWISHPEASGKAYGVFHFRKSPYFSELPDSLIIHVSADNRYRLYINGLSICFGPARGNLKNWYFETVDIAKYLKKGKNTIAAEVWNMGEYTPVAQHSAKTGFFIVDRKPKVP